MFELSLKIFHDLNRGFPETSGFALPAEDKRDLTHKETVFFPASLEDDKPQQI